MKVVRPRWIEGARHAGARRALDTAPLLPGPLVLLLGVVAMALGLVLLTAQLPDDTAPRGSTGHSSQVH